MSTAANSPAPATAPWSAPGRPPAQQSAPATLGPAGQPSSGPGRGAHDLVVATDGLTKTYGDFHAVDHVDLPDGPGLLLQKVTTTGEGKTTSTPAAWLSATPDSTQARTDDMTRLLLTPERISRKTVRMGEGET